MTGGTKHGGGSLPDRQRVCAGRRNRTRHARDRAPLSSLDLGTSAGFQQFLRERIGLSAMQARALGLRVNGMAWKRIPPTLGTSEGASRVHLIRARRKLAALGVHEGIEVRLVIEFYESQALRFRQDVMYTKWSTCLQSQPH